MKDGKPDFEIIQPPDTLRVKAARPGGITRGEAAEIVVSTISRNERYYRTVTLTDIEEMEALAAAMRRPDDDIDVQARRLFKKAHEIWAMGDTFGYSLASEIADSLCAYLAAGDGGGAYDHAIVALHILSLRGVIGREIKGPGGPAEREMVDGLRRAVEKTTARK